MRAETAAAGLVGLAVLAGSGALAGCGQAPAQPPPTVIVNTPPAEGGGSLVLVTVLVGIAFLVAAGAVVCAWGWSCERRSRREAETGRRLAEDVVTALTGHVGPVPGLLVRQDGVWSSVLELRAGRAGDAPDGPAGGSGAGR